MSGFLGDRPTTRTTTPSLEEIIAQMKEARDGAGTQRTTRQPGAFPSRVRVKGVVYQLVIERRGYVTIGELTEIAKDGHLLRATGATKDVTQVVVVDASYFDEMTRARATSLLRSFYEPQ